jgi:class 3 adenylate cyclase/tetratricopeptide (TPR) repeat protein
MPLCPSCGQHNPEVARFCLACGTSLAPPEPAAEERKLITVLFCDIVGSTASAEKLDPEDVRARLAPYYVRARAELERFGGTVEKFIGDAVVALFGAPVAHEDDPERAVRAAFAIRQAMAELNEEDAWLDLKIRVGVNTGEALVVLGARSSEGEGMASGDVMNTAARLQSAAPVDGIVVGEMTYSATRDTIEYRDAESIAAKGKSEPVQVWEAVETRQVSARRRAERPLVGRDAELEELRALWDDVRREGAPALAMIIGPPGIGKSRLIEEVTRVAADDATAFWGQCLPYGEGITYWPVADVLKAAAGILQSDDTEAVSARLGTLLEGLGTEDPDELRTMATAAANLLGTASTPRGTYISDAIVQAELHWGVRRMLQLLANEKPLILVFEDLHWAEPTLLEFLRFLAARDVDAPLLVIGTARPELGDTAPEFLHATERAPVLRLEALPAGAGEELLVSLLGDVAPEQSTKEALLKNAGGNPLFLEETVRMLVDSGLSASEMEQLPVPTSLQSLIAARLDQLPAGQKHVGQHAAVVGRVFWPGAVAHLRANGSVPTADLRDELDELERRDFIHPQATSSVAEELEYAFKHILIRDVAYGQLPKGRRIGLHVRFADWVTALPSGDEELIEIVAWHLEQACRLAGEVAHSPVPPPIEAAMEALSRAAEKAERREGIREARSFYGRALALAGDDPSAGAVELRMRRARACAQLGELRLACEELEEVVDTASSVGRPDVQCLALITLSNIDQRQGRASDARRRLALARPLAEKLGERRLQVLAGFSLAALEGDFAGQFDSAVAELRDAITVAERMDDTQLKVEGHLRLGFLLSNMGELAAAEEELLRCLELAEHLGSRRDEARAAFQLGLVKYYRGNADEAERLNLQARDWLERTSESYFQIQNFRALGLYALARDEPGEAERWLLEAVPLALEEGGWLVLELYRYLAEALVRQGRVGDARELVAFAARSQPEEDAYARATLLIAGAISSAAVGDRSAATASFQEALGLLEAQQLPIELGEARLTFARILGSFGEETGARLELERARAIFKRIDAPGLVEQIDRELGKRASGAGSAGPTRS